MAENNGHRRGTDEVTGRIADLTGILFGLKESAPGQRPGEVPFVLGCETCGYYRHGFFRVVDLVQSPDIVADFVKAQMTLAAAKSRCKHWRECLAELPRLLMNLCQGDDFRRGPYGASPLAAMARALEGHCLGRQEGVRAAMARALDAAAKAPDPEAAEEAFREALAPPADSEAARLAEEARQTKEDITRAVSEVFGLTAELAGEPAELRKSGPLVGSESLPDAGTFEDLYGWLGETFGAAINPDSTAKLAESVRYARDAGASLVVVKEKLAWLAARGFPPAKIDGPKLVRLCRVPHPEK